MQKLECVKHGIYGFGDAAIGCSKCSRERTEQEKAQAFHGADEAEVWACAAKIQKALRGASPVVAMHALFVVMQGIHFVFVPDEAKNGRQG